jgi:hypothetical protein
MMRATKVQRPYFIGSVQLDEDGKEEGLMVRRFVLQWYTCRDRNKPNGRAWARALGISHTWLQGLGRKFVANPDEVRRLQAYVERVWAHSRASLRPQIPFVRLK